MLSSREVAVISTWYQTAHQQKKKNLADALATAQGGCMGRDAVNHDEVMENETAELMKGVKDIHNVRRKQGRPLENMKLIEARARNRRRASGRGGR